MRTCSFNSSATPDGVHHFSFFLRHWQWLCFSFLLKGSLDWDVMGFCLRSAHSRAGVSCKENIWITDCILCCSCSVPGTDVWIILFHISLLSLAHFNKTKQTNRQTKQKVCLSSLKLCWCSGTWNPSSAPSMLLKGPLLIGFPVCMKTEQSFILEARNWNQLSWYHCLQCI